MKLTQIILLFFCCPLALHAQVATKALPSGERALEENQDTLSYITFEALDLRHTMEEGRSIDSLEGDVVMIQDSLFMYCDRAILVDEQYADAYDNVVFIHEDSLQIFADTSHYDGVQKIADLYGEVILQEGGRRLYTTELNYDIKSKVATYDVGGTLTEEDRKIVSLNGIYSSDDSRAILYGNVRYVDSSLTMITDSIVYYANSEQLNIVKPTQITQDSVEIYCEAGIYRLKIKQGILSNNVQVKTAKEVITSGLLKVDGNTEIYTFWINPVAVVTDGVAKADTIIYYKNEEMVDLIGNASYIGDNDRVKAPFIRYHLDTEEYSTKGRARIESDDSEIEADNIASGEDGASMLSGNVSIVDKEGGTVIRSDHAINRDSTTKIYSDDRQAEMDYALTDDTLHLLADTLMSIESFADTDSATQVYHAIDDVSLISGDIAGRSAYFTYDKQDSVIVMTGDPVLWADSVQLTADTIIIHLSNNSVSQIDQRGNAFIISPDRNVNFNQIKCKSIKNIISEGKIDTTFASQNVELCYLALKDAEYQAVNITRASAMEFTFNNADIESVRMTGHQESDMYQYKEGMDFEQYYLADYRWRISERPIRMVLAGVVAPATLIPSNE